VLWLLPWSLEIDFCHSFGVVLGEVDVLSCIFLSFTFFLHFLYTHLSQFASPVILACICFIMFITMLG
jgi:hypothetical protein